MRISGACLAKVYREAHYILKIYYPKKNECLLHYLGIFDLEIMMSFNHLISPVTWVLKLPTDQIVSMITLNQSHLETEFFKLFRSKPFPEVLEQLRHVFIGGPHGPHLQYSTKWPVTFTDTYGKHSKNLYITPDQIIDTYKRCFLLFNPKDYCPPDWHPGRPFITDQDIEDGVFINPPFNSLISAKTGMGAWDLARHIQKQKTSFALLIRHKKGDPISDLEDLENVFTVYFREAFPFLNSDHIPYPRPAHFQVKIMHFGFCHGSVYTKSLQTFARGDWFSSLSPIAANTSFFPKQQEKDVPISSPVFQQSAQTRKKLLKKSSFWEAQLPKEDLSMLPDEMAKLFEKPSYPETDLSLFHFEPHRDFFNYRKPPVIRNKPLKIVQGLHAKHKLLTKLSQASSLNKHKHTLCSYCLHYGHRATTCPEKLPLFNFTESQQSLVNFICSLPQRQLQPFESPNVNDMFQMLEEAVTFELTFWKDFEAFSGLTKDDLDFKERIFGNFQSNLAFWVFMGIPKAVTVQLVRGIQFHEKCTPPRMYMKSEWKDPAQIEWLENWKNDALAKGIILPIPKHLVHICENVFLVNWDDPHRKVRLIFDARFRNLFLETKHFKLPVISDVRDIFDMDGCTVGTDATSAFSHAPITPEEMTRSCLCIPQKDGPDQFFAYTGPPFGVSQVPRVFQRIMGCIKNVFCQLGFPAILYIDDLEVQICKTHDPEAVRKSHWFFQIMQSFGVIYNAKSHYIPTPTFKYLGHIVDLKSGTIAPTSLSINKLFDYIDELLNSPSQTLTWWQKFIGKINSLANTTLTLLLIRQLSSVLQVSPDTSKQKKFKISPHCLELLFVWLQMTSDLNVKEYNFSRKLHKSTVNIFSARALVSDASETSIGAATLNPGIDIRFENSDAGTISDCYTFPLPDHLQGSRISSTCRELWGIKKSLEIARDNHIQTTAPALALICDCKPAIFGLIRGTSPIQNCATLIGEIHLILIRMKIPFTFVWTRRDHRAPALADAYSKPWLFKNPFLHSFIQLFNDLPKVNFLSLKTCFSVPNPTVKRASQHLHRGALNIICLPYTQNHLKKWLRVLNQQKIQDKFRFVCIVPALWSTPYLHKFIKKFSLFRTKYYKLVKHFKHLPTTQAIICSNDMSLDLSFLCTLRLECT